MWVWVTIRPQSININFERNSTQTSLMLRKSFKKKDIQSIFQTHGRSDGFSKHVGMGDYKAPKFLYDMILLEG